MNDQRILCNVLLLVLLLSSGVRGADDPPPPKKEPAKPWRPYPEIPEVLYFESFEGETAGIWDKGSINDKVVQAPGTHSYKMTMLEWAKDNTQYIQADIAGLGPFKLLGGLRSSDVKIQYMLWVEVTARVETQFYEGTTLFKNNFHATKAQTWTPVTLDLATCEGSGSKRPTDKTVLNQLKIQVQPENAKACTAYIDDFIITHVAKPADVLARVEGIDGKRGEVLRIAARDGFYFNYVAEENLQAAVKRGKGHKKPKTILVMTSKPGDMETLKAALPAAAAKVHGGSEFKFVFADAPDGTPATGLEDMHTLLQYNILKSDAEMALLVLGEADVSDGLVPGSETIRAIQERALEAGCIPIVCAAPGNMTANQKVRTNLDRLWSAVITASKATTVPWVDIGFAYKDNNAALEKGELTAIGIQSFAELSMKAIKHVDTYVFGRK